MTSAVSENKEVKEKVTLADGSEIILTTTGKQHKDPFSPR
jgi:hypothetical protein